MSDLEITNQFLDEKTEEERRLNGEEWFLLACQQGRFQSAKRLYEESNGQIDVHAHHDKAFRHSCGGGFLEQAKWIYSLGNVQIQDGDCNAFRFSCGNGQLHVAQWLYDIGATDKVNFNDVFAWTCRNGHVAISKWLYTLGLIDLHWKNDYIFRKTCEHGQVEVIKWLLTLSQFSHMFIWASENGHLDAIKMIYTRENISGDLLERAVNASCEKGQLAVFRYLYYLRTRFLFRLACRNGHLPIAEMLFSPNVITIKDLDRASDAAERGGHGDMLNWLDETRHKLLNDYSSGEED